MQTSRPKRACRGFRLWRGPAEHSKYVTRAAPARLTADGRRHPRCVREAQRLTLPQTKMPSHATCTIPQRPAHLGRAQCPTLGLHQAWRTRGRHLDDANEAGTGGSLPGCRLCWSQSALAPNRCIAASLRPASACIACCRPALAGMHAILPARPPTAVVHCAAVIGDVCAAVLRSRYVCACAAVPLLPPAGVRVPPHRQALGCCTFPAGEGGHCNLSPGYDAARLARATLNASNTPPNDASRCAAMWQGMPAAELVLLLPCLWRCRCGTLLGSCSPTGALRRTAKSPWRCPAVASRRLQQAMCLAALT